MASTYPSYKTVGHDRHVQHSREKALSAIEFELLFEGAQQLKDRYRFQAEFAVLMCGRLGLRRAELGHLKEDWINWQQQFIEIPRQMDCEKGIDGGICGTCRKSAKQRAETNEDVSKDQAVEWQWLAKTDAAARDVYYGYSPRARLWLERFFDRYDGWPFCVQTVPRRIKRAAEHAEDLSPERVTPHPLRATAATFHAGRGLETMALTQLMGWADPGVADVYIQRSGTNTARQLDAIYHG